MRIKERKDLLPSRGAQVLELSMEQWQERRGTEGARGVEV